MGRDSFYILDAMKEWSRELAGDDEITKNPPGLFRHDIGAVVRKQGVNQKSILTWLNSEYDFTFRWEFDEKEEPNKGELVIYNISDDAIREIFVGDALLTHGGFDGDTGWYFHGTITQVETNWKGPDKEVTIYANESGMNVNTWGDLTIGAEIGQIVPGGVNISKTYCAGIKAGQILHDLMYMTGIPIMDNRVEKDVVYRESVIVEGPLFTCMKRYAAICGADIFTVNGQLLVRDREMKWGETPLLINQHSGLLDAPAPFTEEARGEDGVEYRGYTVKMLGSTRVQMGAKVHLESRFVDGYFTVLRGKHSFDGMKLITEATLIEEVGQE